MPSLRTKGRQTSWLKVLISLLISLRAGATQKAIQFYEINGVDPLMKLVFDNVENTFGKYSYVKVLKQWVWEKQCPSVLS